MSAANKAKGSSFEIQTETYLNDQSLKAKRLPRSGRNDIGDVSLTMKSGNVLVLELKNVASVNMKEFLRQADVEADNYDEAIDQFDFKLKYGNINRSDVYVAEIEEKI